MLGSHNSLSLNARKTCHNISLRDSFKVWKIVYNLQILFVENMTFY
jgi:hypothetical protein